MFNILTAEQASDISLSYNNNYILKIEAQVETLLLSIMEKIEIAANNGSYYVFYDASSYNYFAVSKASDILIKNKYQVRNKWSVFDSQENPYNLHIGWGK